MKKIFESYLEGHNTFKCVLYKDIDFRTKINTKDEASFLPDRIEFKDCGESIQFKDIISTRIPPGNSRNLELKTNDGCIYFIIKKN